MSFEIGIASADEIELLCDWAANEGWNPGVADAPAFRAADAEGFLVGRLDGAPVAGVSVVRYGASFGFLGFYLCALAHRGKGYGWRVWQAGMARLAGRTVGLDGVVAQQDNYRKSGFVWAHANQRYEGVVELAVPRDDGVRAPMPTDRAALLAYDEAHFGAPRAAFLDAWIEPASGRIVRIAIEDGRIAGFGVIRPCRRGFKIGPLFADDERIADRLFRALVAEARGATIVLDPPVPNARALALVTRYGMQPVFETARMYRGPAPALRLDSIFGITTFELG